MQTDESAPEDRAGFCPDQSATETTASPSRPPSRQSRRAALISTIEGEMVPRLLMLCRTAGPEQGGAGCTCETADAGDVEELARLLVAHGPEMARAFVEAVRRRYREVVAARPEFAAEMRAKGRDREVDA